MSIQSEQQTSAVSEQGSLKWLDGEGFAGRWVDVLPLCYCKISRSSCNLPATSALPVSVKHLVIGCKKHSGNHESNHLWKQFWFCSLRQVMYLHTPACTLRGSWLGSSTAPCWLRRALHKHTQGPAFIAMRPREPLRTQSSSVFLSTAMRICGQFETRGCSIRCLVLILFPVPSADSQHKSETALRGSL